MGADGHDSIDSKTIENVRQRQVADVDIILAEREVTRNLENVGDRRYEVLVRQHHSLGVVFGSAGVADCENIIPSCLRVINDLKTVALRSHLLFYQGPVFPKHYAILLAHLD